MESVDILLVDDRPANLVALEALLEGPDLCIHKAASGREALGRVLERDFAVILLDVQMPIMDGFETARLIRGRERSRHTPIIFITAMGQDPATQVKAYELGAVDFLYKPIDAEVVIQGKVKAFVELGRARQNERELEHLRRELDQDDRLRAIGQLASGVAHEVNNPAAFVIANLSLMTSYLGRLEAAVAGFKLLARDTGEAGKQFNALLEKHQLSSIAGDLREMLEESQDGMGRVRNIIRDLKAFSRVDQEEPELLDLNDLVNTACNLAFNEIRHRARLVKDLGPLPGLTLPRGRMTHVLLSLLLNATRSIEEGAASQHQIHVASHYEDGAVILEVSATGQDLPAERLEHLFDPYQGARPEDQGMGLGMAICSDTVRQHGGQIMALAREGGGTMVRVTLPEEVEDASEAVVKAKVPSIPEGEQVRVLIIDDEPLMLRSYDRYLSRHCQVVTAEGGAQGLKAIREDPSFDVIICDLMMPEVDGLMVWESVRDDHPALLGQILFCSGGAFTSRMKAFTASMENLVLEKPLDMRLLRGVIQKMTEMKGVQGR